MTEPPDNVIDFTGHDDGIQVISAGELLSIDFPELHWNIQDIMPAGTMLLFGKPKKGKSFLTLMIAICVAAGKPIFGKQTSGRTVLYLALEDSQRRLKRRAKGCANSLQINPAEFGNKLHLSVTSKRIDTGLIDDLRGWMIGYPDTGLIVIDMLKKVTGASNGKKSLYDEQAEVGHALTKFSHQHPELTIVVVHHSRKADSEDPFDLASGTTGLSGSYDSLAAISDTEGTRMLHVTGRDLESAEIPLVMNERGMYTLKMPDPEEMLSASMSDTRRRVYVAVPKGQAYKRADIMRGSGLPEGIVDQQLIKLMKAGLVKKTGRGMYQKTGKRWFDEPIHDDF